MAAPSIDGRGDVDRWVTALRADYQMLPRIVVPTASMFGKARRPDGLGGGGWIVRHDD